MGCRLATFSGGAWRGKTGVCLVKGRQVRPVQKNAGIKRLRTALAVLAAAGMLAACEAPVGAPMQAPPAGDARPSVQVQAANFIAVADAMEPQIEAECRARTSARNCDYRIVVDDRPGQGVNAFQTEDRQGRPIVGFTLGLIAEARNRDELAFVMGHEAAHHIAGHLSAKARDASAGALILGVLTAATGADASSVSQAQSFGADMGARVYSKDYELEADRLGTIITWNAGYDPLRGALFFSRIPDPGDRFLGTHPGNARRIETVRATVARLNGGGT